MNIQYEEIINTTRHNRYENTVKYSFLQFPESKGEMGSQFFVSKWLEPLTARKRSPLAGAYVLDSISTHNTETDSQILPADFQTVCEMIPLVTYHFFCNKNQFR